MSNDGVNNKTKEEYGNKYQEHLLEQYNLYVNGIEKTSDRREGANRYFIAVNTAILTALFIVFRTNFVNDSECIYMFLSILGIAICVVFGSCCVRISS